MPPEGIDTAGDHRLFVKQLRMITLGSRRIENAILDYYRAFQQRSRWAREDLLMGNELASYEARLVDEWQRRLLAREDDASSMERTEDAEQEIGRKLFTWAELDANIRIRPDVSQEYVMRGSFHLLADSVPPRVWCRVKF